MTSIFLTFKDGAKGRLLQKMLSPSLTTNPQITIPALLNGGNVQIVPFGAKAHDLFGERLPNMVKNWSFDMYWIQ
jgi:hypothetical protein